MQNNAQLFSALGDPHRLEMVRRLAERGPLPLNALAANLPISRQAAAKHVKVLETVGLLSQQRFGRQTRVSLTTDPLRDAERWLAAHASQWDARLAKLEQIARKEAP